MTGADHPESPGSSRARYLTHIAEAAAVRSAISRFPPTTTFQRRVSVEKHYRGLLVGKVPIAVAGPEPPD